MGFRSGVYATVWEVSPVKDTVTRGRISISRKDKRTDEYVTDFSGYVAFAGTVAASKALSLHERDRIKLGDVDVTNKYDKDKKVTYTNFNVFSFETHDEFSGGAGRTAQKKQEVDDGEFESDDLPF